MVTMYFHFSYAFRGAIKTATNIFQHEVGEKVIDCPCHSSYFTTLFLRDAEVKRDEHVKDASKLVTRATKYKDEAKREQKKVLNLKIIEIGRSLKMEFTILHRVSWL